MLLVCLVFDPNYNALLTRLQAIQIQLFSFVCNIHYWYLVIKRTDLFFLTFAWFRTEEKYQILRVELMNKKFE
jgi:hypothetical protein